MQFDDSELLRLVRQFPENGIKMLLEHPVNVRDLLRLADLKTVDRLDFAGMKMVKAHIVRRDFRHLEADVMLSVPLLPPRKQKRSVLVYILIEQQTVPDFWMPLRIVDTVIQVYRQQQRRLKSRFEPACLDPVLPVVFYTGTRPWRDPGGFAQLVAEADLFEPFLPRLNPVFINLLELTEEQLTAGDLFLGAALSVLQARDAKPDMFRDAVARAVQRLDTLPPDNSDRWSLLLYYLQALIYHVRSPSEQTILQDTIESSAHAESHRQETHRMGQTIAEHLREQGVELGRQEGILAAKRDVLSKQIRHRFGKLPKAIEATLRRTENMEQLDDWLRRIVTVDELAKLGIR